MITAKFVGRLGNLILQIYNVFKYVQDKNLDVKVIFNKKYIGSGINPGKYKKISPFFRVEDYFEVNKEIFSNIWECFVDDSIYSSITSDYKEITLEDAYKLDNNIDNIILKCPSAVRNFDKELFKKLYYIPSLIQKNAKKYKDIAERVALHIRRMDYAEYKDGAYLLTKDQIDDVISKYLKDGDNKFIVFSDDIEWCKQNISNSKIDIIFHEPDVKSYNDLVLMSLCKKIFRNNGHSTFSFVAQLMKNMSI